MCCNCSLLVHCCNVLMQWSIQIHVPSTGMGPDELTIVVLNHRWCFLVSSPPLTCQTGCTPARSNLLHKPQFSFCCCSVRRLGTPAPPLRTAPPLCCLSHCNPLKSSSHSSLGLLHSYLHLFDFSPLCVLIGAIKRHAVQCAAAYLATTHLTPASSHSHHLMKPKLFQVHVTLSCTSALSGRDNFRIGAIKR